MDLIQLKTKELQSTMFFAINFDNLCQTHILRLIDSFDSQNRQTEPKYQISAFFQLSSTFGIGFKNIPFFVVRKLMT